MAADPTYVPKVHGDGPDKVTVESGGTIDILAGGVFALAGTDIRAKLAALPAAADAAAKPVGGVAAGYKVARGVASVTGSGTVVTGLATVVAVVATPADDPDGTALAAVSATIGDQAGTPAAGSVILKCWKITAADNGALIAATAAKNVNWVAVGT